MSGRRSDLRFRIAAAWAGAFRVMRDITVEEHSPGELVAVSAIPAAVDEELTLDVTSSAGTAGYRVKVIDSRPVVIDGAVRHRLRLQMLEPS